MIATATLTFTAPVALSQDAGMTFWSHGDRFHAVAERTYAFTATGTAPTLGGVVDAVETTIRSIVSQFGVQPGAVEIVQIDARRSA